MSLPSDAPISDVVDEANRKTQGQRRINMVWEATQALIAIGVVGTALMANGAVALSREITAASQASSSALNSLNVMAALVTGFYFGRTNHERVGGVGGDAEGGRR
jgi:hypothetical protein